MKIVTKYYNEKGKLSVLKDKDNAKNNLSTIRFKVLKDGKEFPCCDYQGKCTNLAYAEVYLFLMKNNKKKGWSCLCRKHYLQEQKRLKGKLPSCLKVEW
jgi:hypothetical protein